MTRLKKIIFFIAVFTATNGLAQEVTKDLASLQAKVDAMSSTLASQPTYKQGTRNTGDDAKLLIFSEEVIFNAAEKEGIKASAAEVHSMLVLLLSKQGLINLTAPPTDFESNNNLSLWLKGQNMSFSTLDNMARKFVLWTKLVTKGIEVTEEDKLQVVNEDPTIGIAPERIQLEILRFTPSGGNVGTRTAGGWNHITSNLPLAVRSSVVEDEMPELWNGVNLYIPINNMTPRMRKVVEGKTSNDLVGPIVLESGATLKARIIEVLPRQVLDSEFLNAWITLNAALRKARGQEKFNELVELYFNEVPGTRKFFKTIWGGIKSIFKGLPTILGGGGAVIGSIFGGYGGAIKGFQIGSGLGNLIKNVFRGFKPAVRGQSNISFPQQLPMPPPIIPQQQYVSPMPANYQQVYEQAYAQPLYNPYMQQQSLNQQASPNWMPAMFMPKPIWR